MPAPCLLLVLSLASLQGVTGQSSPPPCCPAKMVGGLAYSLWGTDPAARTLNCVSNCVYTRDGDTGGKYCFAAGDQKATCMQGSSMIWSEAFTSSGLVPAKLASAPPSGLQTTWPGSGLMLRPDMATVDTGDMAQRPLLQWPTEQGALYTVMMLDEGIERLGGLQYVHWMVENVPGNMVSLGDEVMEFVPPFYFNVGDTGALVDDGKPGHPILTLVYKQAGKISMNQTHSGCNDGLATRIGDKAALAEEYSLSGPVAGNFLYTVYSPATDPILCRYTRCTGRPFPAPLPGVNDGPEC